MAHETADFYNPRRSLESTGRVSFDHRTPYLEQQHGSATSILPANFYQSTESGSEPENDIELANHPGTQSSFSNTQGEAPLVSSRSEFSSGMFNRLGLQIIITNIGAVILLLLSISVLSFLWFGGEENKHWRRVMLDGWVGQAVTLSTLAIRLAVSVQACTAVAMLASVSLESKSLGGVLLPEAPALSIARYVNTGPLGSLLYFGKNSEWSFNLLTLSISLLAATTLVSQFTSTLLLWDIRPGVVPGFPREIKTGIGFSMERYIQGGFEDAMTRAQNYWLAPPPNYPSFAEWSSKPLNSSESIMDTGPSIRAFLPIDSESDRSALLEFQGMASAFDARVTCARPTIKDWSFIKTWTHSTIFLNGTLFPPKVTGDLADVIRHDIPPTCRSFKVPINNIMVRPDPTFMIYGLPRYAGGLINSLDPMQNDTLDYSYLPRYPVTPDQQTWFAQNKENGYKWEVELGHSFLIISASSRGTWPAWGESVLDLPLDEVVRNFTVEERGPWLDFSGDSDPNYQKGVMSVTVCYDALHHNRVNRVKGLQDFLVSVKRRSNYSEPKLGWDPANRRFETTTIRSQLDTQQANSDYSAFDVDPSYLNMTLRSFRWNPFQPQSMLSVAGYHFQWYYDNDTYQWNDTDYSIQKRKGPSETYDFLTEVVWSPVFLQNYNSTFRIFVTCPTCTKSTGDDTEDIVSTDMNPVLNAIFVDIMKETDNPALAWQALVTTLMRMAYYDWLPTFDYMGNSTVTSAVSCQKPQHRKGFILVMANLLVHLAFVTVSSFVFFTRTRYSLLSNAWQAIAQIKAPETEFYLDKATMLDDKKIKREFDRKGARRRFNISRNDEDGRVCVL